MTGRLRLGVIGAGWVVETCYLPHLVAGEFEVTAVVDPVAERAGAVAARFPGTAVASGFFDTVAARCDAVLVAAPSPLHAPLVLAALEAGCHVLCEKPVACRVEHARRLDEAARRADRVLMPACVCRHRADARWWLRAVAALGPVEVVEMTWRRHDGVPMAPWHLEPSDGMTGVLADLGYHLVDLAVAAVPGTAAPAVVRAEASCRGGGGADWYGGGGGERAYAVADDVRAEVVLATGTRLHLSVSWCDDPPGDITRLRAVGARGEAMLDGLFGFSPHRRVPYQRGVSRLDGREEHAGFVPGPALHRDGFRLLLDDFHAACVEGRPDAAAALEPVAAIMEAIANGV